MIAADVEEVHKWRGRMDLKAPFGIFCGDDFTKTPQG
jgi:hypothetical protein